jgi:4'-phosphopantetheinyl transferase
LANHSRDHHLNFNLSHSQDLALCAVGYDLDLGIDVEKYWPRPKLGNNVRSDLLPDDYNWLCSLPHERKPEGYCQAWTKLEAYYKARGEGIAPSSNNTRVVSSIGGADDGPPMSTYADNLGAWVVTPLVPAHDYAAALALEQSERTLECRTLPASISTIALAIESDEL